MNVTATTSGVKRCCLMTLPNSKPNTTAGKKPINMLKTKRWASCERGKATMVVRIFCQ